MEDRREENSPNKDHEKTQPAVLISEDSNKQNSLILAEYFKNCVLQNMKRLISRTYYYMNIDIINVNFSVGPT